MRGIYGIVLLAVVALTGILPVAVAQAADEVLELWPYQRKTYLYEQEINGQKIDERRKAYLDHIYKYHGEVPMTEMPDLHGDDGLNITDDTVIETEPVDVNGVASIIKGQSAPASSGQ